ncbi:protein translocase subunit SecD [Luteimicrobium subarcticum]|uniref:Protein translocase subunit SecD n=1 Tax=Luteimicrobium subarcticum TaxID=620910 RepID=A0A2M8W3Z3_9MICO|nr:protein translocase subunit SecD [Luteimicrobium subarcticum]PJI85647.1 preprotein translocase subunit SecD [Luteimicrobium subarcticum]
MATTSHHKSRPGVTLAWLVALIAVVFGAIGVGVLTSASGAQWTPKLALDLEGGTQIILKPVTTDNSEVTSGDIDQAIDVIRQRIDSSGVSEAQITRQGSKNIVVSIPGHPSQETIDLVSQSAQMRFRPVLVIGDPRTKADQDAAAAAATTAPTATATPEATTTPKPTATAKNSAFRSGASHASTQSAVYVKGTRTIQAAANTTPTPTATAGAADGATPSPTATSDATATTDDGASSLDQITADVEKQYDELDCTDPANRKGGGGDDPDKPLVACAKDGSAKYILGPVEIEGTEIASASSGLGQTSQGVSTGQWVVNMKFTSEGAKEFTATTKRIAGLEAPRNQFAMVLDGLVIEAPSVDSQYATTGITGGSAEISGSFTRQSAATLANQLNFGALPLTFEVQSQEQISATLGSEQLAKGLLAGLIGLVLVVVYSMFQYRLLGLLSVASLGVAGVLVYGLITLLSWTWGYRLSLPGVAGLIVAIGFTADSFIVYFERIRDELRDGRPLAGAVEKGWQRARRTILASDTVNILLALILYFLAVGGVQGFAVALGLTTFVDLIVVFLFTHPVMQLIAKVPFFRDGHAASGLSTSQLRASGYKGRGRFVAKAESGVPAEGVAALDALSDPQEQPADDAEQGEPVTVGAPSDATASARTAEPTRPVSPPATAADGRRMTIAERRAAERRAAQESADGNGENEENL